ncbi:hypothetical protein KBD45_04790 [Candidatus Dojkabacteria bacterium]|nr:hypothetical protein [Candidatus Dojkabacteria bacterium]
MNSYKITNILLIILLSLILGGCIKFVKEGSDGSITTKENKITNETVTYNKDNLSYVINKNLITKTADLKIAMTFTDKEEYTEFLGTQVTMAPFMINMMCNMMNKGFFDPESLNDDRGDNEQTVKDPELTNYLEGYKINKYQIDFIDKETTESIASCESSKKGWENISFIVNKDYGSEPTLFGSKIGVIVEEKQ